MKLLRCDDEMCEYEDIDDGQIKVKTITKKIVKLKWEEAPTNVLIIKKQADPLSKTWTTMFFFFLSLSLSLVCQAELMFK